MRRETNLRIWGCEFSEHFLRTIDVAFTLYFAYMIVCWVWEYHNLVDNGGCTEAFGLLWTAQFVSAVIFRLFFQFQQYFHHRMIAMASDGDINRFRNAHFWTIVLSGFKSGAYSAFLFLTIIECFKFVNDRKCIGKTSNSTKTEVRLVIWLLASVMVCIAYGVRTLKLFFANVSQNWGNDNENQQVDQVRGQQGRSLALSEINRIQKNQLSSYDELRWFPNSPVRSPKQISIEMGTFDQIKPKSIPGNKSETLHGTCPICQDKIKIGEWYKRVPTCQHSFHATCVDQWLSRRATCPVCREEVFVDENSE